HIFRAVSRSVIDFAGEIHRGAAGPPHPGIGESAAAGRPTSEGAGEARRDRVNGNQPACAAISIGAEWYIKQTPVRAEIQGTALRHRGSCLKCGWTILIDGTHGAIVNDQGPSGDHRAAGQIESEYLPTATSLCGIGGDVDARWRGVQVHSGRAENSQGHTAVG